MAQRIRDYLAVIFAIFKRDVLRIVKKPVVLIVVLGACALPSIYAWFCTAANWDPYSNTKNLSVAIASDDTGANITDMGTMNVGSMLVGELEKLPVMKWEKYGNSEDAIDSVYSGKCYAAIVVPKDFTQDLASALSTDFKQPQLQYYVNEKISASAPDITNEASAVIKDVVNQAFIDVATKELVTISQSAGTDFQGKADNATSRLTGGIAQAQNALDETHVAMQDVNVALDDIISAADKSSSMLKGLQDSIPQMQATLEQSKQDLASARAEASSYESQLVNALNNGSVNLNKAATQASTSISQASAELYKTYGQVSSALEQAQGIVQRNATLIAELKTKTAEYPGIEKYIEDLEAQNKAMQDTVDSLQAGNNALYNTLQGMNDLLAAINDEAMNASKEMADISAAISTSISPALNASLDAFSDALGSFSGLLVSLDGANSQAIAAISQLTDALGQSKEAVSNADASLVSMKDELSATLSDIKALQSAEAVKKLNEFISADPNGIALFMASPISVSANFAYPVKNYGSGVVAFFTSISLWVAGFVFIDLFKMRVEPEGLPRFTRRQAYFGRWLTFMVLGIIPAVIVCVGDLIMGIQCENPAAFIFAGVISGLVFINLIYALSHAFRYVGKALAVVLLILQIPGSAGLFPTAMLPGFYQHLNPLLPFTYSIDAFRETIGGFYGNNYIIDLCILFFVFGAVGMFIGLVLGRLVNNLTLLFDRDIGTTGLFEGEAVPKKMDMRISTMLRVFFQTPEYRSRVLQRVKSFLDMYPKLRRFGWVLMAAQFLITFSLMVVIDADVNLKLFLLMAMVIGIVLVDAYLIVIVYVKANLESEKELLEIPEEELTEKVRKSLVTSGGLFKGPEFSANDANGEAGR